MKGWRRNCQTLKFAEWLQREYVLKTLPHGAIVAATTDCSPASPLWWRRVLTALPCRFLGGLHVVSYYSSL